jgi:hypothetical protein
MPMILMILLKSQALTSMAMSRRLLKFSGGSVDDYAI